MTSGAPIVLEVQNLSLGFEEKQGIRPILRDISFQLHAGETLAIVGESGSGKSVCALSILRLLPEPPARLTGGSILFHSGGNAVDMTQLGPADMRHYRGKKIAMIFQEPMTSLNPVFTCGDQVAEAIQVHQQISYAEARKQVLHWFEEVQLPRAEQMLDAYPHQISGGQKQRVMIAMAMCNHPDILIADEPTTALDVSVQQTILELMNRLQQKYGTAMIFISHDLGVVKEIADRVLVMYRGEVVESGPTKELFSQATHPYTKGLIACRPDPVRFLKRIPTVADFMEGKFREGEGRFVAENAEIRKSRALERMQQKPVLEVSDLNVVFQDSGLFSRKPAFHAVQSVSFNLYPGEILGLVGESGCGKTTLSRALLRLGNPGTGVIRYKGKNLTEISDREMRALRPSFQLVFQDPFSALNPRLTAGQAVREVVAVHRLELSKREREDQVDELFIQTGLDPGIHKGRYPHEFSGGQRQRICIARALATRPEVLICDESVSALDVSVQAQVLNLLNDLKDTLGFSCLFISHDLQVVRYMSDRIMVMHQGRIVESGITETVCASPEHPYTRQLLGFESANASR